MHTSQFVAVRGTRDQIQPSREGRSEVNRTYLSRYQHICHFSRSPFTCPQPSRRVTGHVLISPYDRIPPKIPPPTLHIRVQVGLLQLAAWHRQSLPLLKRTGVNECVRSYRKVSVTAIPMLVSRTQMAQTGIVRTSPSGSTGGAFSPSTQAASHAAASDVENLIAGLLSQQPRSRFGLGNKRESVKKKTAVLALRMFNGSIADRLRELTCTGVAGGREGDF